MTAAEIPQQRALPQNNCRTDPGQADLPDNLPRRLIRRASKAVQQNVRNLTSRHLDTSGTDIKEKQPAKQQDHRAKAITYRFILTSRVLKTDNYHLSHPQAPCADPQ